MKIRWVTLVDKIELDAVSFHHSVKTRQSNNIPSTAISLLRPEADQLILFPIFDTLNRRLRIDDGDDVLANEGDQAANGANDKGMKQGERWDFIICNPPFFASEEEVRQGIGKKIDSAPAVSLSLRSSWRRGDELIYQAPTAAANELITTGGEVAFVSQMIAESLKLQETCT